MQYQNTRGKSTEVIACMPANSQFADYKYRGAPTAGLTKEFIQILNGTSRKNIL